MSNEPNLTTTLAGVESSALFGAWTPATDAPLSSPCLVTDGDRVEKARWMPRNREWVFPHAKLRLVPTHWMPLPDPPNSTIHPPVTPVASDDLLAGFVLDLSDEGHWLARWGDSTYPIGRDKDRAKSIIERLNKFHRPNLERQDCRLLVCWNLHNKGEPCEYETLLDDCYS